MPLGNLTQEQSFAFLAEVTSTRNLLSYGIRVVRSAPFVDTTQDPILTMLSIGLEKLYKLTLGLVALDDNGSWPSSVEMRAHGHNVTRMHNLVFLEIGKRTMEATPYVRSLLERTHRDPVVLPLIKALDMYGRSGRFYHLDLLGDAQQSWESPFHYWQEVESAATSDETIQEARSAAIQNVMDGQLWDKLRLMTNQRIADSIEGIWEAIAVCGRNHALGEVGGQFGFEVHPNAVGRQW
ncbi:hypothetical protein [Arthrobacter sp. UNC362MFTsu5.1]|uniref:hypothetical protein n=1 Tax=Arthrobacter sp. UNC362MFTsu5.1 TaxID=1449044 RepID=UPI0004813E38|nr:hypothetical protein [Arthrobacter sp. UNC362MFTsu5.1]